MNKITFAYVWSLCIFDLHKEANMNMGNDTNLFSTHNLKRYTASKDQTIFGPICRLHMYILESIGLINIEVADHIMVVSDIALYHSSLPSTSQPTTSQTQTSHFNYHLQEITSQYCEKGSRYP